MNLFKKRIGLARAQFRGWSLYGAPWLQNGGNRRQIEEPRKSQKQAKTAAIGCHPLPEKFHGKQGVCRGLPPVAGGPLPMKEGVDSQALGRFSTSAACPGRSLLQDYARSDARARETTIDTRSTSPRAFAKQKFPLRPRRPLAAPISSPRRSLRRATISGCSDH